MLDDNPKPEKPTPRTGFARIARTLVYSFDGLTHGIKNEAAFRQEFIGFVVLLPVILFLPVAGSLKLILLSANTLVLITELLNSAIECVVDIASPDYNPLAKQAKDMGSAAVLLSLMVLVIAWVYALWQLAM